MKIAVGFLNTIAYSESGKYHVVPGAKDVMERLSNSGASFILNTPLSGDKLDEAIEFCLNNNIHISEVNSNGKSFREDVGLDVDYIIDSRAAASPLIIYRGHTVTNWMTILGSLLRAKVTYVIKQRGDE